MAASDEISPTFAQVEATCIVTTTAESPPLIVSSQPVNAEARPVATTFHESPTTVVPQPAESVFGLTPRDCLLLLFLGVVCLVLSIWHWGQLSGWGTTEVEIERLPQRVYDYRIDMNEATWVEWMQLPGVGQTLAHRIIEHREAHGPFQSVDDLDDIRGIGPKTLEKLRPWLIVSEPVENRRGRE